MKADSYPTMSPTYLGVVAIISCLVYRLWCNQSQRKRDDLLAVQQGCEPVRKWAARWPFGLDLLIKAFRHERNQIILQFFLEVMETSGTTHEQHLRERKPKLCSSKHKLTSGVVGTRGINTIEPKNLEAVLSTHFDDYDLGLRPVHFAPLMGDGIFTEDGPAWKRSRELLRPQFASNRYQNFEEIKRCVESLLAQIPQEGTIDLQPLFFRLTFDTTTFLLFGETTSSLESSEVAGQESTFALAFNLGQEYLARRGRLGNFYWLMNPPEFRKACRTTHSFVEAAVQRALNKAEERESQSKDVGSRYVFIDALVEQTREPRVLRDQCLNVLLAGRDTTACCLTWTMRLLARHPCVLAKLRAEVSSIVGLGSSAPQPTRTDLKKMSYLGLIIREVLRLYPSVPVNSRAAKHTTILPVGRGSDGRSPVLVREGEAVGYCVYAMHRRRDIYGDDANEFRPERWEGDALKDVGYGYLPFNGGPRLCLGQDFALLEAGYTVARLVQRFPFIEVPKDDSFRDVGKEKHVLTLVVSCGEGCRLNLREDGGVLC